MNTATESQYFDPAVSRSLPARPITILIAALGGEGGGVMAEWLVDAACAAGFPVQSTSIPGVAQRTGATTYYIEIFPAKLEALGEKRPVFALTPSPGNIDVMVASELLEAGRAMQNGFVSPERTTLVASTHRIYSIAERMAMGDGRFDDERLLAAAKALSKHAILFDMAALAQASGTVINAVLFGAMVGAEALLLSREACENAIRKTRGAEASLRGFAAGYERAAGRAFERSAEPEKRWRSQPLERVRQQFPHQAQRILQEGVARLADYQDAAYANLYLDRLAPIPAAERQCGALELTSETGRYLALLMSYEDVIRVADLKTRRSRFERMRAEVLARDGEPVVVTEFLKPGVEEIASILPAGIGRALAAWAERHGKAFNVGMHLRTSTVSGFLLVRSLAWLRPLRRSSLRYRETQALIARWLAAVQRGAERDAQLALEIVQCARLIKGYGDTYKRGLGNFNRIFDTLIEGNPELSPSERAEAIKEARNAALAEPEGRTLESSLASRGIAPLPPKPKPLVFMKRPAR